MSKRDFNKPTSRRKGKGIENVRDGAAPSEVTPFAAIMAARRRDARNKEQLSKIAADFMAKKGSNGHT